ncbi:MAG TPA: ABC transporter permease [Vicinamibacterales bacterium]
MAWIRDAWKWLRSVARRRALESGLDAELQFHIDRQTEKLVQSGMSPDQARRQALLKFGGVSSVTESTRDEIRPALVEDAIRDIQHGVRLLLRAPGFTAAALITLALGIGATSAIFSVVRTVMWAPLPYRDPDRLVAIWETNRGGTVRNVIAAANFVEWRERSRTLEHLGMVGGVSNAMVVNGQPDQVSGMLFSAAVFDALGVHPALGRAYTPEEDTGTSVMVLSHEFWQRRLGGRQDVLALTLTMNGQPRSVIGVMPPGFTVVGQQADFLIPYGQTTEQLRAVQGRGNSYALARLRDGVSFAQAADEMRRIYSDLEKENPQRNARRTVMVLRPQEQMVGDLRPAVTAMIGAVMLVLLVACVNVANLLLARSATREREVGMRTALGARRTRLVRQMLTESLVLAAAGGVVGLEIAALCHRGLLALVGDRIPIPRLEQLTLDLPVVAFAMLTSLATGILFGIVPALVSTSRASDALRDGGRHGGGRRLHRVLRTLVVVEVALSLVLLAGAGLLIRSFVKLQSVDPGFRAEGVLTAFVQLPATRYDTTEAGSLFDDSLSRIAGLPGAQRAAGASCLPVPFACIGTSFWRVDKPKPPDGQLESGHIRPVTPEFFKTLGIPQVAGRDFSASDTVASMPVAIVSQELVRRQFGDESPLGRRLRINFDHANGRNDVEWTVVGVVGNIRSTLDGPVRQTIFVPRTQRPGLGMQIFVRADADPMLLAPELRTIVRAMEPEAPIEIRTLEEVVGSSIARPRAMSILVGVFALVALALAAVGVYGVMAYSVRERTQEIGIRMALGASSSSVFRLVIGQALRLVAIGVATGLVAAGLLTRLLERLLFDVEPLDPWTFGGTALVLLAVAAIAAYLPARRGMRMAPVDALRTN